MAYNVAAGCKASSDLTCGALEANSLSESSSSSKRSSRFVFAFSTSIALGASSIAISCELGSGLTSDCEAAGDRTASAGIDSGVTECGIMV